MLKRLIDLLIAVTAFLIGWPILLNLALIVRLQLGSPILFSQLRPGKDGRIFRMYKFRSMTSAVDSGGNLLPDEQRLTRFGHFLRSTSLDELPGLFNVLKGDMSIVGPRPLLPEYLPLYNVRQARRHEVRPGITGWAQVNGRNTLSWEDKFELDVWYVEHQSFWLDVKIIFMTAFKVIKRKDINQQGEATMSKFAGSDCLGNKD
ncbi:sugar transferase [Aliiglaciecola lipolytica]|uniref:Undecaprenyl-phosphate galactose phosphotransferase n=1 Tax=Aliiglaciecola lipolytica E3 TaxID=1127673 RepID=K6XW01_9ALTE|nr:sugar transferase [Aliiglaciecola lipolytica]GAC15801.1 undecaprenyl-phosphate galactose phosphotransferase [Aliiglaciecola lipolytica E3]